MGWKSSNNTEHVQQILQLKWELKKQINSACIRNVQMMTVDQTYSMPSSDLDKLSLPETVVLNKSNQHNSNAM